MTKRLEIMLTTNVLIPIEIKAEKKFIDAYYKVSVEYNTQMTFKIELGTQGKIKPEKDLPGYKTNSINRMLYQDLLVVSIGKEVNIEQSNLIHEPPGKGGLLRYFNADGSTTERIAINHLETINEIILPAMRLLLHDPRHSNHAKFDSLGLVAVEIFTAITNNTFNLENLNDILLKVAAELKDKGCYISPKLGSVIKNIKVLP